MIHNGYIVFAHHCCCGLQHIVTSAAAYGSQRKWLKHAIILYIAPFNWQWPVGQVTYIVTSTWSIVARPQFLFTSETPVRKSYAASGTSSACWTATEVRASWMPQQQSCQSWMLSLHLPLSCFFARLFIRAPSGLCDLGPCQTKIMISSGLTFAFCFGYSEDERNDFNGRYFHIFS